MNAAEMCIEIVTACLPAIILTFFLLVTRPEGNYLR